MNTNKKKKDNTNKKDKKVLSRERAKYELIGKEEYIQKNGVNIILQRAKIINLTNNINGEMSILALLIKNTNKGTIVCNIYDNTNQIIKEFTDIKLFNKSSLVRCISIYAIREHNGENSIPTA